MSDPWLALKPVRIWKWNLITASGETKKVWTKAELETLDRRGSGPSRLWTSDCDSILIEQEVDALGIHQILLLRDTNRDTHQVPEVRCQ